MDIKLEKDLRLVTYSTDLIAIKKGNSTKASFKNIVGALKWLDKNGYEGIKNRVGGVLIDFAGIDIGNYSNSFETENYKVEFDDKKEFSITDLSNRNNIRWFYFKKKVIEAIYHLEINRLEVLTVDELVAEIEELNKYFRVSRLEEYCNITPLVA